MFNLISPYYFCLLEHLHGIELTVVYLLDEHDFAVGALANDGLDFEVLLADGSCSLLLVLNHVVNLLLVQLVFLGHVIIHVSVHVCEFH